MIFVSYPDIGVSNDEVRSLQEPMIIGLSLVIILISLVLLQLSPGKIGKPFNKRK